MRPRPAAVWLPVVAQRTAWGKDIRTRYMGESLVFRSPYTYVYFSSLVELRAVAFRLAGRTFTLSLQKIYDGVEHAFGACR
jgi:hypothetical protein